MTCSDAAVLAVFRINDSYSVRRIADVTGLSSRDIGEALTRLRRIGVIKLIGRVRDARGRWVLSDTGKSRPLPDDGSHTKEEWADHLEWRAYLHGY